MLVALLLIGFFLTTVLLVVVLSALPRISAQIEQVREDVQSLHRY